MVTESDVFEAVELCNKDRTKTFAEFIATVFKDKFVEIYLGDSYEEVSLEQTSMSYPAVFCGQVLSAYRECLVLRGVYADSKNKETSLGNLVFISERAIRGLNEINGDGTMEDMFLRSRESVTVLNRMVNKK